MTRLFCLFPPFNVCIKIKTRTLLFDGSDWEEGEGRAKGEREGEREKGRERRGEREGEREKGKENGREEGGREGERRKREKRERREREKEKGRERKREKVRERELKGKVKKFIRHSLLISTRERGAHVHRVYIHIPSPRRTKRTKGEREGEREREIYSSSPPISTENKKKGKIKNMTLIGRK